jgi:hypothetical protein
MDRKKILSLSIARKKKCDHFHITVDPDLAHVQCGDCGEKLNPIGILARFADKENMYKKVACELVRLRCEIEGGDEKRLDAGHLEVKK